LHEKQVKYKLIWSDREKGRTFVIQRTDVNWNQPLGVKTIATCSREAILC
jgi:hypothetical protein